MAQPMLTVLLLVLPLLTGLVQAASIPSGTHLNPADLTLNATSSSSADHDLPRPPNTITMGSNLDTRPSIRIETTFHSNWNAQSPMISLPLLDACLLEAFGSTLKHRPTDPAIAFTTARHFTRPEPSSPGQHARQARQVRLQFDVERMASPPGFHGALRVMDFEEFETWVGHVVRFEQRYTMAEITNIDIFRLGMGRRTLVGRAEVRGFD